MSRQPAVYILASQKRGTLYIGVTSNLAARLHQHRGETVESFTSRYGVKRLIYVEAADTMATAITREKQLKRWHRDWKINLVEAANPDWRDLSADLGLSPPASYAKNSRHPELASGVHGVTPTFTPRLSRNPRPTLSRHGC